MSSDLENRMRTYEEKSHFIKRIPVIVRIDGKSFKNFTKQEVFYINEKYDFSNIIIDGLVFAANNCLESGNNAKCAYIQSDEISILLTDFDYLNTEPLFNYDKEKIISYFTSVVSNSFNDYMNLFRKSNSIIRPIKIANFLTKAHNYPEDDVVNYFVWRQQDAIRNSISKFCRNFYSDNEMHCKNQSNMHEMLYQKGMNWATDLDDKFKNGVFIYKDKGFEENTEYKIMEKCPIFLKERDIIQNLMIKNYTNKKDLKEENDEKNENTSGIDRIHECKT